MSFVHHEGKVETKVFSTLAIGPNGCCSLFEGVCVLERISTGNIFNASCWDVIAWIENMLLMTDGRLKVREATQTWMGKYGQTLESYSPHLWFSRKQPITAKKKIPFHITGLCRCCTLWQRLLASHRWSLWAVWRKLSDATFYLICWNVVSHVDEVRIFSQKSGRGTRVTADIIVSTTQDKSYEFILNIHWPASTLMLLIPVWCVEGGWERETFAHLSLLQSWNGLACCCAWKEGTTLQSSENKFTWKSRRYLRYRCRDEACVQRQKVFVCIWGKWTHTHTHAV